VLALLAVAYFGYFTLLESYKVESYLLYTVPLFTVVLSSCVCRFWNHYPSMKIALAACVLVVAGLEMVRNARFIMIDQYHRQYLPAIAFLNRQPRPGLLFGPAELTWRLDAKDALVEDLWLGCRSDRKADYIVTNDNLQDGVKELVRSSPAMFACQIKMFESEYRKVYDDVGYVVWRRRL